MVRPEGGGRDLEDTSGRRTVARKQVKYAVRVNHVESCQRVSVRSWCTVKYQKIGQNGNESRVLIQIL